MRSANHESKYAEVPVSDLQARSGLTEKCSKIIKEGLEIESCLKSTKNAF